MSDTRAASQIQEIVFEQTTTTKKKATRTFCI